MAVLSDANGNGMVMPVGPYMGGNGGMFGGNGDWGWIVLLLLLGWNNNGFGGNNGNGGMYPWFNQLNATNDGFMNAQLASQISAIQAALNGIGTQLCDSFANLETSANARQMANMQQMFGIQSQIADSCGESRLATANLGAQLQQAVNTIVQSNQAGFQSIKDQMYQDKMDAKNDEIAQLRQENLYARGQASQIQQNATIVNDIYNRLSQCPVGTVPVYGEQPIFTCRGNNSCGCSGFAA